MKKIVWLMLYALLLLLPTSAFAQFERRLIADEFWTAPVGANDLLTIHEALVAGQNHYLPHRFTEENTFARKLGGVLYRVGRTVLLENIVDNLIFLTQHEVFGHGARYREYGDDETRYSIHLFPPFGNGSGTTYGSVYDFDFEYWQNTSEDLIVRLGGSQANTVLAHEQRFRLLSSGMMNHRQSNLYLAGMLDFTYYVLRTQRAAFSSNDVANSVYQIYGSPADQRLNTLKKEVLLNFLDPMQWYAAYNLFVNNFWFGNESMSIPMLHLADGWKYLPNLRVGLTPYGTEYFFENYAKQNATIFGLVLAMDELKEPSRISLDVRYLPLTDWLRLDGQLQIWKQPRFRGTTDKISGVLFSFSPTVEFYSSEGRATSIFAQFGYKSRGFIEGETFDVGPILRAGLSFR